MKEFFPMLHAAPLFSGISGEELLPRLAGTPVIVLSAKSDVQGKVQLLLGGAADSMSRKYSTASWSLMKTAA